MKESGINYFYNEMNLNTGFFGILYTFEEGAGTKINSVSGGQSQYSGTLSSVGSFWSSPGSGFFNGTTLTTNNASGIFSENWTKIFVYEKINVDDCVLFSSLNNTSGYKIGITKTNKPYFESYYQEPMIVASNNNYSSKNVLSVGYFTNHITFGYYNFNSQTLESEGFSSQFQVTRSDIWELGKNFTGYMDYHIHLTSYQSPEVIGQLLSGLYARPTGIGYSVSTIPVTGITGYQNIFVFETGVTGYQIIPSGDEGQGYYTGTFPLFSTQINLTGYLSTGLYSSGLQGVTNYNSTGSPTVLLEYLTGYISSFGMQKIQIFMQTTTSDIINSSWDYTLFNDIYNKMGQRSYSGYLVDQDYGTGFPNIYYNGIAQATIGWTFSGNNLIITGTEQSDIITFDLKSGNKQNFTVSNGNTGFNLIYSGQQIFLNGVNLISGYDFLVTGSVISLTSNNTGVDGYFFEVPIVLTTRTGSSALITGKAFSRNSSNIFFNGVRQQNRELYIEGAIFDLLSGNFFNYSGVENIYDNNNLYWES